MIQHAGLVAYRRGGRWAGALIVGPSGSGKSDLALRAIALGLRLVADDRTVVFSSGGRLFGRAAMSLRTLLEVRGVGIARLPQAPLAEISLVARCVDSPVVIERQPEPMFETIEGVAVPVVALWPFEASAAMKLIMALEHLGARGLRGYQAGFAPLDRRAGA